MKKVSYLFLVAVLLVGGMLLTNNLVHAVGGTVTSATYVGTITTDDFTAGTYKALTGPVLTTSAVNDLIVGSVITITAPAGFNFKTTADSVTATPADEVDLGGGAATAVTYTPTATTITIPVTVAGNDTTAITAITLSGIEVVPTTGVSGTTGEIGVAVVGGNFGSDATSGTLTEVAGNLHHWGVVTQHSGVETAGTAFTLTITAQDQNNNVTTKQTDGTALGTESFGITTTATSQGGSDPTYAAGAFPAAAVAIDMATGTGTSGAVLFYDADEADPTISVSASATAVVNGTSAAIAVGPAAANKLAFTTQPDPSPIVANVAFTTQPIVKIQDTYGNTRTGDTDTITLSSYSDNTCDTALTGLAGTLTEAAVAGVANFVGNGVKFTGAGNNTLYVKAATGALTKACSALPGAVTVNPAVPSLVCAGSGQGGAIFLSWTIPYGVKASGATYEGQYISGNSITWDGANTAFGTTWVTGTAGGADQQLVTGLNPSTQYTFMMHTLGNNSTESADSNAVTCYAPGSSGSSTRDLTAPTSYITSPASNSTVLSADVMVKGTAQDTGGSSVQKVEVSVDGGTNWSLANVKAGDTGTNVTWEYTWSKPATGTYTVKTRAYDWIGNQETAGAGIVVKVTSNASEVTTTASTTVTTTPATGTAAEVIKAKIIELQTALLSLLQQLLAMLVAQLGH